MARNTSLIIALTLLSLITTKLVLPVNPPIKPFISVVSPKSLNPPFISPQKIHSFDQTDDIEEKLRDVSFGVKCFLVDGFNVYDLSPMTKNPADEDAKKDFELTLDGVTIHYNFCTNLNKENNCNADSQVTSSTDSSCTPLADSIGTGNKWKISDSLIEIDLNTIENSISLVKYQLKCDPDLKDKYPVFVPSKSHYNKAVKEGEETLLYFKSQYACPKVNFYSFWSFIDKYDWMFAILLIIVGLFECVYGRRAIIATSFIISCIAVALILVIIATQFLLGPDSDSWTYWLVIILAILIGLAIGYLVSKNYKKSLVFIVGGVGGFFLGELLFNLFGNRFGTNLTIVHILFIIVAVVGMIILATIFDQAIMIFSTAFIGSYMVVRGLSLFIGGFPSESTIIDIAKKGETEQFSKLLNWSLYLYLGAIVFLTIVSIFLQLKMGVARKKGKISLDDIQ